MEPSPNPWFVYLLVSTDGSTYVGATVNVDRRLRQHNGLLKGGAKATSRKPNAWRRHCFVQGFPDNHAALSFEWRWKRLSQKKEYKHLKPLERRLEALQELLRLDRPTSTAVPYALYPEPLQTLYE
jgi:structure-specific endonuclease subunit SLX1